MLSGLHIFYFTVTSHFPRQVQTFVSDEMQFSSVSLFSTSLQRSVISAFVRNCFSIMFV